MRLEINSEGKPVLREVDDAAWAYIEGERNKLEDANYRHWYFGEQRYDGTVYLTVLPQEDKTEFVEHMDKLEQTYGLTATRAAAQVLYAWRREAACAYMAEKTNKEIRELEWKIRRLKRIVSEGCEGCPCFVSERKGDDENGYCTANGRRILCAAAIYPFRAGEPFRKMKFYPNGACERLR